MNAKSTSRSKDSFRGVFVALVTPMTADEEIDLPKLAELADHLIRQGVHGLVPLGSTGEYYALSADERERVLRTTLEAAAGRVPVVPGTNAGSTRDVIAFSRQAEQLGCAGVMLAAPYYSLPRPDELFVHFKAVNDAIGVPIIVYNYPGRTGVDMPPEFLERLAELRERSLHEGEHRGDAADHRTAAPLRRPAGRVLRLRHHRAGESDGRRHRLGRGRGQRPARFACEALRTGRGEEGLPAARKLFFEMLPTLELMEGGGKYTQWVKAACGLMGYECGPPRRPLGPATKSERTQLREALRQTAEGRRTC